MKRAIYSKTKTKNCERRQSIGDWSAKTELIKDVHNYFISKSKKYPSRGGRYAKPSPYSKGDVDIFLQASPLTQGVMNVLQTHGIGQQQVDLIDSFVGNSGLCQVDLERYVTKVMGPGGVIEAPEETDFVFAMSKSAVSCILGKDGVEREYSVAD